MQEKIRQILDLLRKEYGIPKRQPHSDAVSVLVQTILSQNTSDKNSRTLMLVLLQIASGAVD
jgi:endonuclease III